MDMEMLRNGLLGDINCFFTSPKDFFFSPGEHGVGMMGLGEGSLAFKVVFVSLECCSPFHKKGLRTTDLEQLKVFTEIYINIAVGEVKKVHALVRTPLRCCSPQFI